jgi:DNA-directed RNA polymerase specialized sigma24 family protein/ribosome-associated translation inhibitor RaiA
MKIQWVFNNCPEKLKTDARYYWEKKQNRIDRLTAKIPKEEKSLRLVFYFHKNKANQYEVRAILEIPGRSLTVQASDMMFSTALDELANLLAEAFRKYMELMRHTYRQQRKNRHASDLGTAFPLLLADEKGRRKESFFSLLRPRVIFLEEQAQRELKILELEDAIRPDYISAQELVDEVVVLAYERFSSRPADKNLEHWLNNILYELLRKVQLEANRYVSLDEAFLKQELDQSSETDWIARLFDNKEKMTLAELIPDQEATNQWEKLEEESRQSHINEVLQSLSGYCRQAYLMHLIEGFTVDEISEIQDRSVDEVTMDINRAKEAMRTYMHNTGMIDRFL